MHGRDGTAESLATARLRRLTLPLLDAGWVLAASDAHGKAWGSRESQDDYLALHKHVTDLYDVDRTVIVTASMGAVAGLNLVATGAIPNLGGWVGVCPVVDLADAAERGPLRDAIGKDVPASQIPDVDPATIPPGRFRGVPMRAVLARGDRVVSADAARDFAERIGAEVLTRRGGHVASSCYRAGDVLSLRR